MRRRKRETTNANAVHGNAFVNGIFGYLHRVLMKPLLHTDIGWDVSFPKLFLLFG